MGSKPYERKNDALAAIRVLEDEFNVQVFRATATGARARETAHDESDIDLFAFAVNEPSQLVTDRSRVYREFEVFEYGTGVDVQLWTLPGVYDGILDDNPTVIEAFSTPATVYDDGCRDGFVTLRNHVLENHNQYQLIHHYRSLAKNNYTKYITSGNDPTVNRLFFVVDALLRSWYIEENGTLPPYSAPELSAKVLSMENTVGSKLPDRNCIGYESMIEKKRSGRGEQELHQEWVDDDLLLVEEELDRDPREFDSDHFGDGVDPDCVTSLLSRIAEQVWGNNNDF